MALATALDQPAPALADPSWNPLRCAGTALPPAMLMTAKLIAVGLVALGYLTHIQPPRLPLFGWPYHLPGEPTQRALQLAMAAGIALLVFNRAVRASCVLIASALALSFLLERSLYTNAQVFAVLLLLFIGLYDGRVTHALLRWQLALMYFGAFLNKLLDPAWQNGVFFDYLIIDAHRFGPYIRLDHLLPEGVLGLTMSWMTIATELALCVLFALPRAPRAWLAAVVLGVGFHGMSVVMTGTIFGIYVPAVVVAYLLVFQPPHPGEATLRTPRGRRLTRLVTRLDLDRVFRIEPTESGSPTSLDANGRKMHGWLARVAALAWLPMTWLVLAVVLAALRQAKVMLLG